MATNPHHNSELESRLLSCCLWGPEQVFAASRDGLCAEAFHDLRHRSTWNALTICAAEDRSTEISVLWRRLSGMTGDGLSLSPMELSDLYNLEPTSLRQKSLLSDVLGLWRQRRLCQELKAALEKGQANAGNWTEVWESVEPHLRAAQSVTESNNGDSLISMAEAAEKLILHGDRRAAIKSGIESWDNAAGSPRAGELIVIAGRPGTGKTALALQMALTNARRSTEATAFFSLEMSGQELVVRMAAHACGRPGMFEPKNRAPHAREIGRMRNLQIYEGRDSASVSQIESRARLLAAHPSGLGLVVIDYLQLVSPPPETRRDNRERQVAEMSRRFKLLAQELQCPVVLLAQLNRESEKDQRRPRMSDLRESGAIEQDADRIWFLYTETPAGAMPPPEDAAEIPVNLYQAKCRNGQPGIVSTLRFTRPIFTFTKP
jgi:replicative DNA helicase